MFSLPGGRVRHQGLELVTRYLHPGISEETRLDLPSSWGISIVRLHVFLPTPAGLLTPDHYGAAAWPLDPQVQRLPRKVFRRPIAWLSDSLSTLRRADYSDPTQDSLPVAGQALPDGLSTHKIPMRGFKIAFLHLYPPLPSFAWRNGGDRRALGTFRIMRPGADFSERSEPSRLDPARVHAFVRFFGFRRDPCPHPKS